MVKAPITFTTTLDNGRGMRLSYLGYVPILFLFESRDFYIFRPHVSFLSTRND